MLCKLGLHKYRDKYGKHPNETLRLGYSVQTECKRCHRAVRFVPFF